MGSFVREYDRFPIDLKIIAACPSVCFPCDKLHVYSACSFCKDRLRAMIVDCLLMLQLFAVSCQFSWNGRAMKVKHGHLCQCLQSAMAAAYGGWGHAPAPVHGLSHAWKKHALVIERPLSVAMTTPEYCLLAGRATSSPLPLSRLGVHASFWPLAASC